MAASYTGGDDALSDTSCDSAFDDSRDRVHRADDFGLELWGYVEFDLLEKVFGSTEAAHNEDVLNRHVKYSPWSTGCAERAYLEDSILGLNGDYLVAD